MLDMFYKIYGDVYRTLRESAALTQPQLAVATGTSTRTIQRIESGKRLPTCAEETAIIQATGASTLLFAEMVCKALSGLLGRQVAVVPEGGRLYQSTTPLGEVSEFLRTNVKKIPRGRWRSAMGRLGRVKALSLILEQELLAILREVETALRNLGRKESTAGGA